MSGGERKRVSIGVELVAEPSLIMLDEPTSGLDSFKARGICKLLHDLARKKGKTIVSTIHSPSSEAFFYFDRLILMADGFIVYQGDAGDSMEHFRNLKFTVPRFANPADFFLKALSINYPKRKEDEEKLQTLTNSYRFAIERKITIENQLIKLEIPKEENDPRQIASLSIQIAELFKRSWILAKREPRLSRAKVLQVFIVACFMVPVFWQIAATFETPVDVQNVTGAIYFTCVLQMYTNFLPTVIVFQSEKPIYVRERATDLYKIWVYATTKMLAEMPISTFVPLMLCLIIYWAIGFQDVFSTFMLYYVMLFLMVQAATALGYFLSSAFNHETTAVALSPLINLPLSLLGGFMINLAYA